ncbi:DNA cytosine methyltransferase [Natribacillus halophilus]|uniref:Cytosine-specific methyltransferase n=1 Tax=Natribacillus halophilus TaxID=549003 RepID=A0A1G8M713_9BACI|nr:DNA cytosine methyltransferase [Natribacillus halophilus]SDI63685.1 DNA (cytosine-5)-methyltransferase 1 [Natribacillus halophilus]
MLSVMDLFSGVGGLSHGFRNAGFKIVLSNEIDSDIAFSYQSNHIGVNMLNEDITKIDSSYFHPYKGNVDVIIGGPPCQGFSQKGHRNILEDDRNFLFRFFYNVVEYIRPTYFLIENVPNILTTNNGHFKKVIYDMFNEIGYNLDSAIINAFEYGVPQIRRRAFILGKYNGHISLPLGTSDRVTAIDAIEDLAFLDSGEGEEIQEYKFTPHSFYQSELRKGSTKLFNHVATKHSKLAIERMRMVPKGKGRESLPKEHHTKSIYSGTWGRIIEDQPSVTMTTRFDTPSSGRFTHPFLHRAITVREAARFQSFPDTFRFYGTKSSQMKQVGNAVPPKLALKIAEVIYRDMTIPENIVVSGKVD